MGKRGQSRIVRKVHLGIVKNIDAGLVRRALAQGEITVGEYERWVRLKKVRGELSGAAYNAYLMEWRAVTAVTTAKVDVAFPKVKKPTIRKRPIPVDVAPPRVRKPVLTQPKVVKDSKREVREEAKPAPMSMKEAMAAIASKRYIPQPTTPATYQRAPEETGIGAKIAAFIANIIAMITGRR